MPFRDPEPYHQPVVRHVSPRIQEFLFWEERSANEWLNGQDRWVPFETRYPNEKRFPNHVLAAVVPGGEGVVRLCWAANRAEQEAYNFEVVENPGSQQWPRLRQVWIIRRSAYSKGMSVAAPPAGVTGTWTRVDDVLQDIGDETLDRVFVRLDVFWEDHTTDLEGWEHDSDTGAVLPVTVSKVPAGTAGQATDSAGLFATVDPLNVYWALKTTRKASALVDDSREWWSSESFPWPPVLTQWQYWQEGERAGFNAYYKEYFGEVKVKNVLAWFAAPPPEPTITPLVPTGITWQTPVGSWNVRSSLHGAVTGSYVGPSLTLTLNLVATTPEDWPDTVVRVPLVQPHPRGGWLRHTKEFYKPGT